LKGMNFQKVNLYCCCSLKKLLILLLLDELYDGD